MPRPLAAVLPGQARGRAPWLGSIRATRRSPHHETVAVGEAPYPTRYAFTSCRPAAVACAARRWLSDKTRWRHRRSHRRATAALHAFEHLFRGSPAGSIIHTTRCQSGGERFQRFHGADPRFRWSAARPPACHAITSSPADRPPACFRPCSLAMPYVVVTSSRPFDEFCQSAVSRRPTSWHAEASSGDASGI
jgi:hypothetical protein